MKRTVIVVGLCLICAMAVFIGAFGIYGMTEAGDGSTYSQNLFAVSMTELAKLSEYTQRLRFLAYDAAFDMRGLDYQTLLETSAGLTQSFEECLDFYEYRIVNPEVMELFKDAKNAYFNEYKLFLNDMLRMREQGVTLGAGLLAPSEWGEMLAPTDAALNRMSEAYDVCMAITADTAAENADHDTQTRMTMTIIMIVLIMLEVMLSAAFIIAVIIVGPSQKTRDGNTYSTYPMYPVPPAYAAYPADPSNPAVPPNATHMLYPVYPAPPNAPQNREQTKTED